MKKSFLFLFLVISVSTLVAQQKAKLSPLTSQCIADEQFLKGSSDQSLVLKKTADGKLLVGALIKINDAVKAHSGLSGLGINIGTKAGNIWTVKVPKDKLQQFTQLDGISYIQLDEPVKPDLNVVRTNTRADSVQKGISLPQAYSGKGVVMGVIDFGFDYTHPSVYDTLGSRYRIKRVWELNSNGTPPAGFNYGNELTDTNAMKARGTDNAQQTHGACVAGIAAGSGYGSLTNNRFRGIAYDADLVFVGVRRDSIEQQWLTGGFSDFLDGIAYIFNYAGSVNKPAVVNISWGSQSGPHDGTTLFNEACDNMASAGKIIVMSAGNDGEEKIHLSKSFNTNDTLLRTFLDFVPANYKRTWVDIWGDSAKTFCAKVSLFSNGSEIKSTNFICIDDQVHNMVLTNEVSTDTCTVQFITSKAEYNGKPRLTINLFNKTLDSVLVSVKANDGTLHLWNEYYYYGYTNSFVSDFSNFGYSWADSGNTQSTTSDMGSARSVLLIGAHISKTNWKALDGQTYGYNNYTTGKIAPFSSRGPLTNGSSKPDFTAPGLTMATAVSSFETKYTPSGARSAYLVAAYTEPLTNKKFYYCEFTGTSASAPVTSGIVALMLQANPLLSPAQTKRIIQQTAITDTHTGTLPLQGDNTWGYGKINAYAAVKRATQETGLYSFAGAKLDCALFPNPNNGVFVLDYSAEQKAQLKIEAFDLTGKLVKEIPQWETVAGINIYTLDLSALNKGLYIIKVSSKDGMAVMRTLIQ